MVAQPCRTDGSISPRLFNEIKKIENQVYDLAFDIEMDTLDTAKICMDVMH